LAERGGFEPPVTFISLVVDGDEALNLVEREKGAEPLEAGTLI
jgi:hypothetical protein